MESPSGLLLIDKPQSWTSHDVVAKVRGIIKHGFREESGEKRKIKVGHSGTLDPMATGLLVLLIGSATKSADTFSKQSKCYEAEITFGASSNTDDAEGEITPVSDKQVTHEVVQRKIAELKGEYMQVPPAFSAIKVQGQRSYKAARKGEELELEARKIVISSVTGVSVKWPKARFNACVSSGTYIRSIARDLGSELEVGAYLSALRRVSVGKFDIAEALPMKELNYLIIQKHLFPLEKLT